MKALVLAGGYPQIALLNELRSRGISTILADYYESPVAKPYADVFYQESTLDVDAIRTIAEKEKVDFVITACTDQALLTMARVSEDLNLPCYINYNTALKVTNKHYMKEVFRQNGIPTAKHITLTKFHEKSISKMSFPLVVKPADCNSSKGVKKVESLDELKTAFDEAIKMSRSRTAIIEEFIIGDEVSVDVYVKDGVANVLAETISEKIQGNDKFIIYRALYPVLMTEDARHQIQVIAQQIADAFELKNSPMLIQMLYDGEKVYVIEFSARAGGGVKYKLIRRISGFDVISAVVDLTLGIQPEVLLHEPESHYISNEFIYCSPGTFDRVSGANELLESGVLSDFFLFKWKGAHSSRVENSGDRVAGFTIQADALDELKQKHLRATTEISIMDIEGRDIMRRDLLTYIDYYD